MTPDPPNAPCTCKVTGPGFDQTKWNPACPYHGKNGTMIAVITIRKPV